MSWRGEAGGIEAAKQKHDVLMTPSTYVYFDYSQTQNEDSVTIGGYINLEKVYNYEPHPKELTAEQASYIKGIQANLWTEYITNPRKVEYMIFPRITALSEVAWSAKEKKNWSDFERRLPVQLKRYDLWNTNYSKAYYDLHTSVLPTADYNGVLWKVETKANQPIAITNNSVDSVAVYNKPLLIKKSGESFASFYLGKKLISASQKFSFNKATGRRIELLKAASKNYPGDGAFTLVNGVQNEKGNSKAREFLGFEGIDCEAIIYLQNGWPINSITIHTLDQPGSWIWRPLKVEIYAGDYSTNLILIASTDEYKVENKDSNNGTLTLTNLNINSQYVKIIVKNWGTIPQDNPGAGKPAWLFVDEIEMH
jgi:hexosaminidase